MARDKGDLIARNFHFIVLFVFTFVFLLISLGIPYWGLDISKIDYHSQVDPSIVNGILTATTLVFGIVVSKLEKLKLTP